MDTVERWTGPLLLVGGAMYVVAEVIHPRGSTSLYVLEPLWVPAHLIEYVALTTILLGFVGWYSRFSTSLGRLGTVGFLLSFFGAASGGGYILVSEVLLRPYIVASSPSLDQALLQNGAYVATTLIVSLTLVVGYLAFSVAVVRAKVLPSWVSWLIVLEIISLASLSGLTITFAAALVSVAIFGLSVAGWGYAILSTRSRAESSDGSEAR